MPAEKDVKAAPLMVQLAACVALVCGLVGVYTIWESVFPPSMTAYCAYLIEEYPPSMFGAISEQQRESTLECLYLKRKYNQTTWKVNPNFTFRKGD